jgi:hypothetical protein
MGRRRLSFGHLHRRPDDSKDRIETLIRKNAQRFFTD